jgi:hypothetical protein
VTCAKTITGTHGNVTATGPSTCIVNATITGTVHVKPGAALFITHSTLHRGISSASATRIAVCASNITGSVEIHDSTGFVLLGDPGDDGCPANKITGTVNLDENTGGTELDRNRISGSVTLNENRGTGPFPEDTGTQIEANTIGGSLHCTDNTPHPTNDEKPNTVRGSRTNQCAKL